MVLVVLAIDVGRTGRRSLRGEAGACSMMQEVVGARVWEGPRQGRGRRWLRACDFGREGGAAAGCLRRCERCGSRPRASAVVRVGDASSVRAPIGRKLRRCGQHERRKLQRRRELPTMAVGAISPDSLSALGVMPRLVHVLRVGSIGAQQAARTTEP